MVLGVVGESMDWCLRVSAHSILGEGICWHEEMQRMLFVDVHGCKVHAFDPITFALQTWELPQRVGWLIPRCGGPELIAGLQEGFAFLNLSADGSVTWSWLARLFEERPSMRLNDAKADRTGRIWAGSLNNDDESKPEGALHCLEPNGSIYTVDTGYCVANGPAISPDGQLFLHTDSARKIIYAFDFDEYAGVLRNKRVWLTLGPDEGYPDGMNFDVHGKLWLAHWGAGLVSRYDVDGTLLARIRLPVTNVTNVAFGGADLDRLFVTTARVGLSESQLSVEPLAGGLFELLGHGVSGLAALPFAG
jgi:D-xylonolactonase